MINKFTHAYMDAAERFAKLSTAHKLKVGCIIVKEDRIISIGYNGMPSGWSNECEIIEKPSWATAEWKPKDESDLQLCIMKTKPEVLHAEANAITKLARSSESGEGATLYVTHTPCIECAKLIYQTGVKQLYVKNEYVASKGSGLEFLEKCDIPVTVLS